MPKPIIITKADGTKESFESEKLVESLRRVGGAEDLIAKVVEHVWNEVRDEKKDVVTTGEIYHHAFELLREHAMPVAVKYSLRRALSELGPDGFPFEKYIARIFQAWGYETLTDQMVMGGCVAHEMDVVAWNKQKLVMVEAKFHNEFGLKSDLKVALYVKARFDDLKENKFSYGGTERTLTEGWVITNTKFTEQAIKYGECKGLKMLGWNYPKSGSGKNGNLQSVIEELRLHPFTCLASLSNVHKKNLLLKGVVLCKDLLDHPEYLKQIGMTPEEIERTMQEVGNIL